MLYVYKYRAVPQSKPRGRVKKQQLLYDALESVRRPPGLRIGGFRPAGGGRRAQADGTLDVNHRGKRTRYIVVIKPNLASAQVARLADEKAAMGNKHYLLVTTHVTPSQADTLEDASVEFIDTVGNCFLQLPNLYLFVAGSPKPRKETRDRPGRLFTPSGLKVVFAFLTDPRLKDPDRDPVVLNKSYLQISDITGVSPGTITWTRRDLEKAGFMHSKGRSERRLVHRQELMEQWVSSYVAKLRPKLAVARFRSPGPNWWRDRSLTSYGAFWGGEVAAAKLTGYLTPEFFTIYQKGSPNKLILDLGLVKDTGGDIEMLEAFWGSMPVPTTDCVHPLLVYADLVASDIGRNLKAAQRVYEAELRYFAEAD